MSKKRPIGKSGIHVQPIGLGAMPLSLDRRPDEKQGIEVLIAALDGGMDFIDTADVYCIDDGDIGHNERLIAKALSAWKGDASSITVATKGGLTRPGGDWVSNARPGHLRQACEASLKALSVDTITLYQLHAPDPRVPFEDSVGELARLREEGKIRHVGLSNVTVQEIEKASAVVAVVSVQNRCNPLTPMSWQNGVIAHCEANDLAFIPYSPVGGHFGKAQVGNNPTLNQVGKRLNATPYQVTLAWLLRKSRTMIPIPGASRVESALGSVAAMDLELDDEAMNILDRAFPTQ